MTSSRALRLAACCFLLAFTFGAGAVLAQSGANPKLCGPSPCGDHCKNVPYKVTDCWTTSFGPAAADVILVEDHAKPTSSPNMLRCSSGPYALCFYSGPNDATGKSGVGNKKLPCLVEGSTARCTCEYFSSGENYVDINGILNLHAYYQTVAQCGQNGAGCANITNIGKCKLEPKAAECQEAAVCQYVRDQNAAEPAKSLVPGADTISDFSFAMAQGYDMSKVTECKTGRYAGCMTAACYFPDGKKPQDHGLVHCNCPIAEGPFQVGQIQPDGSPYACDLGANNVWSASRTVSLNAIAQP